MQTISQVAYLNQFNQINFYKFALVDPQAENGYTPVTNAQYVNCPNVIIFNKVPDSSNAAKYDIVGNIKLPNVQVYLSETDWTLDSNVPAENKLLTLSTSVLRNVEGMEPGKNYVLTDEEGNFSFKNIYGSNNYYVWAKVTNLFSLMMMPQFQINVIQKVIDYGNVHDYFIFKAKKISPPKCNTCGGAGFHNSTTECPTCEGGTYTGPFTCPDCNGEVEQPCELCEGGSRSGPFTCPDCDGAGSFDVGVIDCPSCGGSGCPDCGDSGLVTEMMDCENCGGSGEIDYCPDCGGSGSVWGSDCWRCGGLGEVYDYCPDCGGSGYTSSSETVKCGSCNGTGNLKLSNSQIRCVGTGPSTGVYLSLDLPDKFLCQSCHGEGKVPTSVISTCSQCSGKGYIDTTFTCTTCSGTGMNCPTCSGTIHEKYLPCTKCSGSGKIYNYEPCECTTNGKNLTIFNNHQKDAVTQAICEELINSKYRARSESVTNSDHQFNFGDFTTSPNKSVVEMLWTLSPIDGDFEKAPSNEDMFVYIPYEYNSGGGSDSSGGAGGGGDECLAADTLITMADGSLRRLDSLSPGEKVMDRSGNPNMIYRIGSKLLAPHRYYYFSNGTVINEIARHRFYNVEQGFYQLMQLWKIGEHALDAEGNQIELVRVEEGQGEKERYGIFTASGTYYANGLLSGQARCNLDFVGDMTAEKAVDMLLSIDTEDGMLLNLYESKGVLR